MPDIFDTADVQGARARLMFTIAEFKMCTVEQLRKLASMLMLTLAYT